MKQLVFILSLCVAAPVLAETQEPKQNPQNQERGGRLLLALPLLTTH